ncbi:MAG: Crp/Fnr family transcriptional regulator [Mariprofundaceae bacterium]|nr:Crp/Fnr family transcriptional regulator [Mariprofundaceae bacterium]
MNWLSRFPELDAIADPAWRKAAACAQTMRVKPGYVLFRDGGACNAYVLVISGSIRVQKMDPDGHEIVLYRVEDYQSCMLTTTCLIGHQDYPAEGVAETEVELVVLPAEIFQMALAESGDFRSFVMRSIGQRIADLMALIEEVAFARMDVRIARLLLSRCPDSNVFHVTHQEISAELGTAREVVSRVLKNFEGRGWISLGRGHIRMLDEGGLESLCDIVTDPDKTSY